jgi:hypothetical protein
MSKVEGLYFKIGIALLIIIVLAWLINPKPVIHKLFEPDDYEYHAH